MKSTLAPGAHRTQTLTVDDARAIDFLGDRMRVYSTPSIVHDVEYACFYLIAEHLDEGESSLGVHVEIEHLGGSPIGAEIRIEVEIVAVDERKITLEAQVHDAVELVAQGHHTRVVVDTDRYARRFERKLDKLAKA